MIPHSILDIYKKKKKLIYSVLSIIRESVKYYNAMYLQLNVFYIKGIKNYQKKININKAYSILCRYRVIDYHNPIKTIMMYNLKINIFFFYTKTLCM